MGHTRYMLEVVRREQKIIRDRLRELDEREKVILTWVTADDQPGDQPTEEMIRIAEDMADFAKGIS